MRRLASRKSHSWWWDSHINPKNSRWLAENLEEMDQSLKRMLKLIEDDGDSFAKKADMYYRKRPELISNVEEFYRMYRSLAERYDHLTIELRKNIPSDLQSQGSGISELGYETPSSLPSPDLSLARRRSGQQAAGFDYFLGGGGSLSDNFHKEADDSYSLTDSDPECDSSSVNNYSVISGNGGDQVMQARVSELENELLLKEKLLKVQHDEALDASWKDVFDHGSTFRDTSAFVVKYEEELRIAKEKLRLSEEEMLRLKVELQKFESPTASTNSLDGQSEVALVEELKNLKEKLQDSQSEINSLKKELESSRSLEKNQKMLDQLEVAQKDAAAWRAKFNKERREVTKLQDRLARLKNSLSDRDHEIRELKLAVSDAEEKIFPEKFEIKAEIVRVVQECERLEEHLREWESHGRAMEEEIRKLKAEMLQVEERLSTEIEQLKEDIIDRDCKILELTRSFDSVQLEKNGLRDEIVALKSDVSTRDCEIVQINGQMHRLQEEHAELVAASKQAQSMVEELRLRVKELEGEVENQRLGILEGAEEKREAIRQLCFSLEHYRSRYHKLRHAFLGHNKQFRGASAAY